MNKQIYHYSEIKDRIIEAVDIITKPIAGTLSPQGANVIYEDDEGEQYVTNDGVTIAKSISLEGDVENAIVEIIKYSALKTNQEAGDGAQLLSSLISSPTGWIKMGDIKVGDKICGTNKTTQEILGVYPQGKREVYDVYFSGGKKTSCCAGHLWSVTTSYGVSKVLPLKEIIKDYKKTNQDGIAEHKYFIPTTVVDFKEDKPKMPLDPYFLGALLGDGSLTGNNASIELSLGKAKEHIIDKIVLPKNVNMRVTWVDKKNYYRIKFTQNTSDEKSLKDLLKEVGLLGTTSHTKFIPEVYLYSSVESRTKLLQGLTDTDGYINPRGLFKYCSVSKRLADDFLNLCRSLGKQVSCREKDRSNAKGYSANNTFHVEERVGYKYGEKIINIVPTGKEEVVQCIKVSNLDNLYITDDFITTHNTSTTILLASILIKEGLKLIEDEWNPMKLKKEYVRFGEHLKANLKTMIREIKTDEDRFYIANIAANNDKEIAKDVCRAVKIAGQDGLIFFDSKGRQETEIMEDTGFMVGTGMFAQECTTSPNAFVAAYKNVPVLVTDKRLYYAQEAETILKTCLKNGYKEVVIVARDFIGEALPYFIANHTKGTIKVLLIKDPLASDGHSETLEDLAIYLGDKLITDKTGNLVDNLKIEDFSMAKKVYSDLMKTILSRDKEDKNEELDKRIEMLRSEIDKRGDAKDADNKDLKHRLAALTNGMVTIYAGGSTHLEIREKVYRYEDSVNALRAAIKDGYLIGGGTSVLRALSSPKKYYCSDDLMKVFKKYAEANVRQIAINCGLYPENVIEEILISEVLEQNIGYNALTGCFEDLLVSGVVDPYKVTELTIDNSISIANVIISSGYLIVNSQEENGSDK